MLKANAQQLSKTAPHLHSALWSALSSIQGLLPNSVGGTRSPHYLVYLRCTWATHSPQSCWCCGEDNLNTERWLKRRRGARWGRRSTRGRRWSWWLVGSLTLCTGRGGNRSPGSVRWRKLRWWGQIRKTPWRNVNVMQAYPPSFYVLTFQKKAFLSCRIRLLRSKGIDASTEPRRKANL